MNENEKLREQLQSFITQYEVRDKFFETQIQAKEAEKLLAEEKQAKVISLVKLYAIIFQVLTLD
jgi:hypothetical protein